MAPFLKIMAIFENFVLKTAININFAKNLDPKKIFRIPLVNRPENWVLGAGGWFLKEGGMILQFSIG